MADAPSAAAKSAAPSIRVSEREMGPDCIRSSALPAAIESLLVDQANDVDTRPRRERASHGSANLARADNRNQGHSADIITRLGEGGRCTARDVASAP